MSDRITRSDLEHLRDRINKATGSPMTAWSPNGSNIGHYYLSGAYGGMKLERMDNKHGGCETISTQGFGTKRQLYVWMTAFLAGLATKEPQPC